MGGELHARLLGHGNHFLQKSLQPPPEFFVRNRGQRAGRRVAVVDHVPYHAVWNRYIFGGTVHAEGDCMAATERRGHAAADARQTEVVAEHGNAGFTKAANDGLHFFDLLRALRTIEKNVVPVRGIKVFDRRQDQACVFNFGAKGLEFSWLSKVDRDRQPLPKVRTSSRWADCYVDSKDPD